DELARGSDRLVAQGRLAATGPSLFSPAQADPADMAGHGVADPSSLLLATALMLREGLGEPQAAESLTSALAAARRPVRRALTASTRDFADAVVRLLPS